MQTNNKQTHIPKKQMCPSLTVMLKPITVQTVYFTGGQQSTHYKLIHTYHITS